MEQIFGFMYGKSVIWIKLFVMVSLLIVDSESSMDK